MDKIQNIKQFKKFFGELKTVALMQTSLSIVVDSDMLARKLVEPAFKKMGFSQVKVMQEDKALLEQILKFDGPIFIWFELKPNDPFLGPFMQIVQTKRTKKPVCTVFCGRGDDKASLVKVLSLNEQNILVRPLDSKTLEEKLNDFLSKTAFSL